MGRRSAAARFMPHHFVFPGGCVEAEDHTLTPSQPLSFASSGELEVFALTALRETFEEVGLMLCTGSPSGWNGNWAGTWQGFWEEHGRGPDLRGLGFFAQATTPPIHPLRFNTRFFVLNTPGLSDAPLPSLPDAGNGAELEDLGWRAFEDLPHDDMPWITGEVLRLFQQTLSSTPDFFNTSQFWHRSHEKNAWILCP